MATDILEGELRLTVNTEKTHLVHASQGVKFLGVEIELELDSHPGQEGRRVQGQGKSASHVATVPSTWRQVIADLNPVLRGFANYFRMANCTGLFRT